MKIFKQQTSEKKTGKSALASFFFLIFGLIIFSVSPDIFAARLTEDRKVQLRFEAPSFVTDLHIASNNDFSGMRMAPYSSSFSWDVCNNENLVCKNGTHELWIRFVDRQGNVIHTTSEAIVLDAPDIKVPVIAPTITPKPKSKPTPVIKKQETKKVAPNIVIQETPRVEKNEVLVVEKPAEIPMVASAVAKGVVTAGLFATLFGSLVNFFSGASSFSQFGLVLLRIWNAFLVFIGIRKRAVPWGIVYDSVTKQPIDPAYVVLKNQKGEEVNMSITDINGRFGFLIEPGSYTIETNKSGYTFPSKRMMGRTGDALYDDVYLGEPFSISKDEVMAKNIPLDPPAGTNWNQDEKKRMGTGHLSASNIWFTRLINAMFYGGLLFAITLFAYDMSIFNGIMVSVYAFFLLVRELGLRPRSYGVLKDGRTGIALQHALVRVFSKKLDRQVGKTVADAEGHYFTLINPGEYYITLEKKNGHDSYEKVHTSEVFKTKRGYINKNITL